MKHLLKVAVLVCVVTLFLGALSLNTAGAKASSSPWRAFQNHFILNAGSLTFRSLDGVAAVSANDVWAVGSFSASSSTTRALIEHWNGKQWSVIANPNPGSVLNSLSEVGAVSTTDVWAVGVFSNNSITAQTLIEHWNGSAWSVVKSPNPPRTLSNVLNGIAVISASNIWAVGTSNSSKSSAQTLVEHWNGSTWSIVKSSGPGTFGNTLNSAAAVTANNIWAVGSFSTTSSSSQTLVEHWNGSIWSVVKSPSPGSSPILSDVAVVSANNIWAVGSTNGFSTTLIEHWNGAQWSVVNSPNPSSISLLIGVAAASAINIWSVGQSLAAIGQTLIEHWNGSAWVVFKSPNQPGSTNNFLLAVTVISATDIWAVGGYQTSNNAEHTLTEHWNGSAWTIVPSP